MKKTKIKDCLPLVNGVWNHINYQFPDIFDIDSSQLDIVFLSNWSMRTAAPILRVIHSDEDTTMLNSSELDTLADIINGMYKHKWDKLMAVAEMEYDPIHNFSDHLVEEIQYSEDNSGSKSGSGSSSSTRTDNLTSTETDRRGYTDTFNDTNTRTDSLTETTNYGKRDTKTQTENGFKEQVTNGFTEQVTDGHTNQTTPGYTEQDANGKAFTEQDASHKRTTEELIAGFNSSDYEDANKTITDEGRVYSSQGKINNSQGNISTSQGKILNSSGKVLESMGIITDAIAGSDIVSNTGTQADAHTGTVGRTNSGTLTTQDTGTQTNSGTTSSTETSSNDTDGEKTREYTKTGNIGNISTQKLLNEEIDLWKYNFILEMMRDVINFISLPIYEH